MQNSLALIAPGGARKTYQELKKEAMELASTLDSRTLLLMMFDISMETVSLYFCALDAGIVPLPVNPKANREYILELIHKYRPKYLWLKKEWIPFITDAEIKIIKYYEGHILYGFTYEKVELHPDLALILTTSGSTGSPKMVRLSYRGIKKNAELMVKELDLSSDDCGITLLPLYHCLGLTLLHAIWFVGGRMVLYNDTVLNPHFLDLVSENSCSITFIVPYIIKMIGMTDVENDAYDCLKIILLGGDKPNNNDLENWKYFCFRHNIVSYFGYGQTEGTGFLSGIRMNSQRSIDNIGFSPDGIVAYIDGKNDVGIGELIVRGDCVFLGYADDYRDLKRGDDNSGCLRTGDLASMDSDGSIYLRGRTKRIAKLLGERINLDDIEQILTNHFKNCEFACTDKQEELIIAYVKSDISKRDIEKILSDSTGIHKKMLRIIQLSDIPRLSNGKTDYVGIRALINEKK